MISLFLKSLIFACLLSLAPYAVRAETPTEQQASQNLPEYELAARQSNYQGDIFLLRGFANIFSRGLDEIGDRLKAKGINAQVYHHSGWRYAARTIIANQKKYGPVPVVLIGHSLGANAIIFIAERLKRYGIKVQYLVTFEPTRTLEIPSNVGVAVNYYLSNSSMGLPLKKARGSRGSFENKNMISIEGIGHFNIEKQPVLQQRVIEQVLIYIKPRNNKKANLVSQ